MQAHGPQRWLPPVDLRVDATPRARTAWAAHVDAQGLATQASRTRAHGVPACATPATAGRTRRPVRVSARISSGVWSTRLSSMAGMVSDTKMGSWGLSSSPRRSALATSAAVPAGQAPAPLLRPNCIPPQVLRPSRFCSCAGGPRVQPLWQTLTAKCAAAAWPALLPLSAALQPASQ